MQASDRQWTMTRPGCSPAAAESRSPDDRQGLEADQDGSSRQLRALFDRLPAMVFSAAMDCDRTLLLVSDGCEPLTGRTAAELIGPPARTLAELIHPDDRARVLAAVQWAAAEGCPYQVDYRLLHADGGARPVRERGDLVDAGTDAARVAGLVLDRGAGADGAPPPALIDRPETCRGAVAGRESADKLRQVQKMEVIGLLAGGVAHDFNNILSVILGYAAMALAAIGDTNPVVRRDLDQIQQAGLRARDLVRQILDFCHHAEERFQPLRPHRIVREVVKMLRSSFPATIEIVPRLTATEASVLADPSQLHQVLMNLCTNALHAMKEGGELTLGLERVTLAGEQNLAGCEHLEPGPYLRLWVRDTGCGIPAEIRERIFEPFFTTKGEGEGTGLGLAVVQGIVVAHRGAVSVTSRPGEGTEVSVYLPELVSEAPPAEAEAEGELPTGTESILVIDDEPGVALVLERFLQTLGYTVETFTESPRALETYARDVHAWDLVLTDMTMPGFTGLAISRAMLALRPDQPIIICTGYSERIDQDRARAEGIRALLAKPVALDTLARAVRRALDNVPPQPVPA